MEIPDLDGKRNPRKKKRRLVFVTNHITVYSTETHHLLSRGLHADVSLLFMFKFSSGTPPWFGIWPSLRGKSDIFL